MVNGVPRVESWLRALRLFATTGKYRMGVKGSQPDTLHRSVAGA